MKPGNQAYLNTWAKELDLGIQACWNTKALDEAKRNCARPVERNRNDTNPNDAEATQFPCVIVYFQHAFHWPAMANTTVWDEDQDAEETGVTPAKCAGG